MFVVLVKDNANDYWFCYGPFINRITAHKWIAETCNHLTADRIQVREILSIWPWKSDPDIKEIC